MNQSHGETRAQQRSTISHKCSVRERRRNDSELKAISREVTFVDERMGGSALFAHFVRNGELNLSTYRYPSCFFVSAAAYLVDRDRELIFRKTSLSHLSRQQMALIPHGNVDLQIVNAESPRSNPD